VADRWGNFYSAFYPIYDSHEQVVGVVGVDFDASWYDEQVFKHSVTITVVSALSIVLGVVAVALMSHRVRVQLDSVDEDLSHLSNDVDHLMMAISNYSSRDNVAVEAVVDDASNDMDEIGRLSHKIHVMQDEMNFYLDFLHQRAYIDSLTNVGNSAAYHQKTQDIDVRVASGLGNFWVLVFDLNGLKDINDSYGHDQGNHYITATAKILHDELTDAIVYRIGGDEFCGIAEGIDEHRIHEGLASIERAIDTYNETARPCDALLSLSHGAAHFDPEQDTSFNDVFIRADKAMYENKRAYYETIGRTVR
jgi:diguanylate cyclase (GGDEF)-like protein